MVYIPNAYSQLDQWNSVMFLYESALKAINTKIEILNEEFIHIYGHKPIEHIKSRVKTPDSIVKKMKRNGYAAVQQARLRDRRGALPLVCRTVSTSVAVLSIPVRIYMEHS